MIKAAIDIGTNSTRLYIADAGSKIKRIEKRTVITRLGKGVDSQKRLSRDAIERNVGVLLEYKKIANSYGVDEIKAIATSAVRDASNRETFIKEIKDRTGIDVKVISGNEEAELDFLGASSSAGPGRVVVCDIGGGSCELISGKDGKVEFLDSIDVGAVRMTERFLNNDVCWESQVDAASKYIKEAVFGAVRRIKSTENNILIGIGGTITTLAAIDLELREYDFDKVNGHVLSMGRVNGLFNSLKGMSLLERQNVPGLQKERADIIPAGALILKLIMESLNAGSITASESDNLDGIIIKYMD